MEAFDTEEYVRWRERAGQTLSTLDAAATAQLGLRASADRCDGLGSDPDPSQPCDGGTDHRRHRSAGPLKGLLHSAGAGSTAWGHDVMVLERRVAGLLGDAWSPNLAPAATRLSRLYIPTRYPDANPGTMTERYTAEDVTRARADAAALLDAVDGAWRLLGEQSEGHDPDDPPG